MSLTARMSGALLVTMLLALSMPRPAAAQIGNRLAIGGSITIRVASSPDTVNNVNPGFEMRIGHEQPGWGWVPQLFGWFDLGVQEGGGAVAARLGTLRMRPMMVGYGYTRARGRTTLMADLAGGFSFNSFHAAPGLGDGSASNVFTLKPEVVVWYDINDRVALKLNGGYLIARPSVTLSTPGGDATRPVKADVFLITVGLVYSLF